MLESARQQKNQHQNERGTKARRKHERRVTWHGQRTKKRRARHVGAQHEDCNPNRCARADAERIGASQGIAENGLKYEARNRQGGPRKQGGDRFWEPEYLYNRVPALILAATGQGKKHIDKGDAH